MNIARQDEIDSQLAVTPAELPRPSLLGGAMRLGHMSLLGTRHLTPALAGRLVRRNGNPSAALRRVFERLGATYVKFGQFMASAPGIVGQSTADEFRDCLDTGPPAPFDYVRSTVESELGRPLDQVFANFDRAPIAAASIAVVHSATLPDGARVAVKVLRNGIERTVATDVAVLERFARFMAARGVDQAYNVVGLVVGLRMQIAEELDLRNEARTMDVFRAVYERCGLTHLVVPGVYHDLTARRVVTMEFLDGKPLDDFDHARRLGADPAPLVRELLKAWILTGLRMRAFHADIHAGNLLLLRDGRLGMLDWGIVARMGERDHRMLRSLCLATLGVEGAWRDIGDIMLEVNGPSFHALGLTDEQVHTFARSVFEPVLTKPLREVSMGELMMTGDDVVYRASGERPSRRSLRDRLRAMRAAARSYRTAAANGAFEDPSMRMGFLSMKQLVYLERYGRMYIPDEAIFGDHEFIRRALEDPPVTLASGQPS